MSINPYVDQSPITTNLVHYTNNFGNPNNFIKRTIEYKKMKVYDEKFRKGLERLISLQGLSICNPNLIPPIAKSGFFNAKNPKKPDQVRCIYCQGLLSDWKRNDVPVKRHKYSFPTCPFILYLDVGDQPVKSDELVHADEDPDVKMPFMVINLVTIKQKIEDFSQLFDKIEKLDIEHREKTFTDFPHLKHFAFQGLYVIKKDSETFMKCICCTKEMLILKSAENMENKIWHSENCQFFKYDWYAKDLSSNHFCDVEYSFTEQELNDRVDRRLISQLPDVDPENLNVLLKIQLAKTGRNFESIYEMLVDLKKYKKFNRSISVSLTENNLLYLDFLCVICIENPVEVIFLPCGHLKTCSSCASLIKNCPVCRVRIDKKVKRFRFNV